jgi:thioredoxin reductase (NADPH)
VRALWPPSRAIQDSAHETLGLAHAALLSESYTRKDPAIARRYGADYRVVSQLSAAAALRDLARMRKEDEAVALIIADQWMPEMNGIDLLARAHEFHPSAQRALLVNWGDQTATSTILRGCAFGQIENYLHKPWSPAEIHLYPLVGEFLADWTRAHGPKMEFVRVVATDPSPRSHEIRSLLERSGIPHGFHLAESESGRRILDQAGVDGTATVAASSKASCCPIPKSGRLSGSMRFSR